MKPIFIILIILAGLVILAWLGLQIKPAPFPAFAQQSVERGSIPLPDGLPAPVVRFYRKVYGEKIPLIESVVVTGRAEMRPFGSLTLPARYRFTHDAGRGYRHYIEATWFNLPIMKVNERYLDGKGLGELPFGLTAEGPHTDQAANLGMWAELSWVPAVFLTDSRVRWEPFDDATAVLVVPFEGTEERFIVRFDPENDMLRYMEVMRFRDEKDTAKSLWITESRAYGRINGQPIAVQGTATWFKDGRAWAVFTIEDIRLNVDVSQTIRAKGLD